MKKLHFLTFLIFLIIVSENLSAQSNKRWNFNECLTYALSNNIDVKSAGASVRSSLEDLKQAKETMFPSLSFSSSQNVSNSSYSGTYSFNSGITIYKGKTISNNIKLKENANSSSQYSEEETKNNITLSVTQAFLDIIYANETLQISQESVSLSESQLSRAKAFLEAGSISQVDLAQFESQLGSDKYQLTLATTNLAKTKLALKQLLELGISDDFDVEVPEITELEALQTVPSVTEVYSRALSVMPQIAKSKLSITDAKLNESIAKAASLPQVSASASLGTSSRSGSTDSFTEQLNNSLSRNIGLTLSIPIYNNRSAKTQINKSKIETEIAVLNDQNTAKQLLSTIEDLYQQAISAQSKFIASSEKLKYYTKSFNLINEQFNSGMKNTVELMTERKNYLSAKQEMISSKLEAAGAVKMLKFYCNSPIEF